VKLQLSRGRDLFIVTQADTLDAYQPLRESLVLTGNASYVIELLDRFVYEQEGATRPFSACWRIRSNGLAEGNDTWLAVRYYEMRLLDFLGFRPQLLTCARTVGARSKRKTSSFRTLWGESFVRVAARGLPHLKSISVETLKYFRHFQRSSYSEASRARPDAEDHGPRRNKSCRLTSRTCSSES
jgi:DNA repair protein RecO (recombination protein O)